MHLAICDDNVADRKQLERLLGRESDRRSGTTGTLYVNSYGNAEALLANPMQYDAFYLDLCHTPGVTGQAVTEDLLRHGVRAPIILCCSEINYRELTIAGAGEGQLLYLDKPIQTAELSASLDRALTVRDAAPDLIELRETKETLYVTEPEILYGTEGDHCVEVHLTGNRIVQVSDTVANLFSTLESHPSVFSPNPKSVINARHIQSLGFLKAVMTDGTTFRIRPECMRYAKYAFEEFGEK